MDKKKRFSDFGASKSSRVIDTFGPSINDIKMLKPIISSLILIFVSHVVHAEGAELSGKQIFGKWKVSSVLVDLNTQRTLHYQFDDPQLKGHMVQISEKSIASDLPEKRDCKNPTFDKDERTLQELIKEFGTKAPADLEDTALKNYDFAKGVTSKEIYWVNCADGRFGPKSRHRKKPSTWISLLSDGSLAIGWFDSSVLILKLQK